MLVYSDEECEIQSLLSNKVDWFNSVQYSPQNGFE